MVRLINILVSVSSLFSQHKEAVAAAPRSRPVSGVKQRRTRSSPLSVFFEMGTLPNLFFSEH